MYHKTHILLVDDEQDVLDYLQNRLEQSGYQVTAAGSGPAALQAFESSPQQFDLLLTDVVMPTMSGFEVAKRLHALAPELKILFMSGYTGTEYFRQKGMLVDDLPFIEKPFHIPKLVSKIEATMASEGTPKALETVEEAVQQNALD